MSRKGWGCAALLSIVATLALASAGRAATLGCDVASIQAAAPKDTTIVSAQMVDKPVANCRVDGYVTTTNPGPNKNNFRLQLPLEANWTKRYYFIGMGGAAGYVPTDSQIPPGDPVAKGFVVAGTDTGHTGALLDWTFMSDPVQALDHVHRGAHVVAVSTQQITRAYYSVEKFYRYHAGCSGGGRMGMEVLQRHPEDFDGVLLGWPGGRHPPGQPAPPSEGAAFDVQIAEMTREPGAWLSPAKLKFADQKVTEACDDTDGAHDGLIWDHRLCHFDFNTLRCKGADQPDCLTGPEITSINNLLRKTAMPISNMSMWMFLGRTPPPWSPDPSPANMAKTSAALVIETTYARGFLHQPDRDILKNPLTRADLELMNENQRKTGYNALQSTDLTPVEKAGTKAIFFVGVSDPCCSNIANENYVDDVRATMGRDRADKFIRLYEIPGSGHCGGGLGSADHPDRLLQALIDWVEEGKAPEGVVAHSTDRAQFMFGKESATESGVTIPSPGGPSRDFLLCPYPLVSVFDKSKASVPGAVWEAANWSCRTSRD